MNHTLGKVSRLCLKYVVQKLSFNLHLNWKMNWKKWSGFLFLREQLTNLCYIWRRKVTKAPSSNNLARMCSQHSILVIWRRTKCIRPRQPRRSTTPSSTSSCSSSPSSWWPSATPWSLPSCTAAQVLEKDWEGSVLKYVQNPLWLWLNCGHFLGSL